MLYYVYNIYMDTRVSLQTVKVV